MRIEVKSWQLSLILELVILLTLTGGVLANDLLTIDPAVSCSLPDAQVVADNSQAYIVGARRLAGEPITMTTRITFPPNSALNSIELAGLATGSDRGPVALALIWRKKSSGGLFPVWEMLLKSETGLLPPTSEVAQPTTVIPMAGQTYEASLSYDPRTGGLSAAVTNLTSGTRMYAAGSQAEPYTGPLYAFFGAAAKDAQDAPLITLKHMEIDPRFVPVGARWRLLVKENGHPSGKWQPLSSRQLNRLHHREVAFEVQAPGFQGPGYLRVIADRGQEQTELLRIAEAADRTLVPVRASELPVGNLSLALEYVGPGEVRRFEARKLQVGMVYLDVGPIVFDSKTRSLSGELTIQSDGPLPGVSLEVTGVLTALSWQGRSFQEREETLVPIVKRRLDQLAAEGMTLPFQIPIDTSRQTYWSVGFKPRITGGVATMFAGEEKLLGPGGHRPRIFLRESDVEAIKDKVSRYPWARSIADAIIQKARSWLQDPMPIPEGQTGWYHNYFDPRYGVRLRYDRNKPHEHVSPVDGKVFSGGEFDAAWRYQTHTLIAQAAFNLALAYRLTEDEEFGQAAADILVQYAKIYPSTREHGEWAGKGRMMGQSLDEAVWVISLLRAYDLLLGRGCLDVEEQRTIERDMFLPVAELLRKQTNTVHNIHSWHNAAIGMVGLLVGDADLVDFAVSNPGSGFIAQVTQGIQDDGFWYEGSIGYHFYTASSLQHLVDALKAAGLEVPHEERVKLMYLAPIHYADPDLGLPALNDSFPGANLYRQAGHYEVAAGWWDDPRFRWVLHRAYTVGGQKRSSVNALLYGPPELAESGDEPQLLESYNFAASGIGILRRADNYALLKYGPHGGGHGHPDKLGLVLYGMGEMLSPDLGTPGYGVPLTKTWYRQTVSHNTVVVDERTQRPTTGELLAWIHQDSFDAISAQATGAYPGVTLWRTLVLTDQLLVFLDKAESEEEHCYDWVYHSEGTWVESESRGLKTTPLTDSPFRAGSGYEHFTNIKRAVSDQLWRVGFSTPKGNRYNLFMAGEPGTEVFLAEAPGNPATKQMPAVIARRRGKKTTWAGVFDLSGQDTVRSVELIEPGTEKAAELGLTRGDHGIQITHRDGKVLLIVISPQGEVRKS